MSDGADRRLHPATIALRFVREAPSTILALPAALAFVARSDLSRALAVAAVLGVVLLTVKWLAWRRFRYGVGPTEIVIESGILHRNRRSIPFDRVQDVDIERSFLARLFGLAKVRIETGAGGKDEGLLDSVSLAEAHRLRETVRASRGEAAPAAAEPGGAVASRTLFAMDVPRVLLFGLFNFSLVYIAGLFALLQTFDDFLPFDIYDPARWVGLVGDYLPDRWTPGAIAAVLFLAVLLGSAAGLLRTLARDYAFRLSLEGDRFRRERGLFTRSEVVIARRRVQLAQVLTGPVRAAFGWSGLSFQTLGAGTDSSGLQSAAPFAKPSEIGAVLAEAPRLRLPTAGTLVQVSSRHILRSALGLSVPALAGILALSLWDRSALLLAALLPLLGVVAALDRRFHRYALAEDLLFVARGVWRRRLWLIPLANVQSLSLSRGLIQRRLGLATLAVDTAGASLINAPRIVDVRADLAEELAAEISRLRKVLRHAGSTSSAPLSKDQLSSGRKSGTDR